MAKDTLKSRTPKTRGKNDKATLKALDRANTRAGKQTSKPNWEFGILRLARRKMDIKKK